jgi:hypothetical protein
MVVNFITQKYSRLGLSLLFLTCAFPLHLWTLLMAFRDIGWLTERTNLWDAVGVAAYGLIFAFVETVLVFLVLVLLGFVIPRWDSDRRIAFLALLILITLAWGMIAQLLFIWNVPLPAPAIHFLRTSHHPLRILYEGALVIVIPTVLLPVYWFLRAKKAVPVMQNIMERISVLAAFYLIFDVVGLAIVIIRNLN